MVSKEVIEDVHLYIGMVHAFVACVLWEKKCFVFEIVDSFLLDEYRLSRKVPNCILQKT